MYCQLTSYYLFAILSRRSDGEQPAGRDDPVHPLVVLITGQRVGQTLVVGHPHAQGRRVGEKPVAVATTEPQPSPLPVEGHAGHQHHIQRGRVHDREIRCGFQHAKAMAHQAGGIVEVETQVVSIYAGDDPADVREEAEESPQVRLVAEGQVGEDADWRLEI